MSLIVLYKCLHFLHCLYSLNCLYSAWDVAGLAWFCLNRTMLVGYKGLPTGIELVEQLKKVDDEEADNKGGFDRAVRVTTGLCLLVTQCRDQRRMYIYVVSSFVGALHVVSSYVGALLVVSFYVGADTTRLGACAPPERKRERKTPHHWHNMPRCALALERKE